MSKTIKDEEGNGEEVTANEPAKSKIAYLKHKTKFHLSNLLRTKKRKIFAAIIGFILILVILFAIPFTRYGVLGSIVKKEVTITVVDSKTKQPVSNALVKIGKVSKQTDKNGVVKLGSVPVGQSGIEVTKQYYKAYTHSYTVPVLFKPESPKYEIVATGRQVNINVVNKITGKSLEDVVISSSQTKATTQSDGTAHLILAPAPDTQKATLTKQGYNTVDVELKVSVGAVNTYSLTPAGSIYYLSKATGTINVMKSNLDGTNPVVAVAGTGQEADNDTSLLSARDWQYSALIATRTDNKQSIYLVDSLKGDLSIIDQGDASFSSIGWSGHNFIYMVYRNGSNVWDSNRQLLKSFNADTRKISVIDQTAASGSNVYDAQYQNMGSVYILDGEVVYLKSWSYGYYNNLGEDKTTVLQSADPGSATKKTVKSFPVNQYVSTKLYKPQSLYVRVGSLNGNDPATFYEYENGSIKVVDDTSDSKFNEAYTTFLVSPSGKKTLWYEPRDGKNTVFVGDENGDNAQLIASLSDYTPYGWYGSNDEYILMSKNGSELYVASASGVAGAPLKVTDYHKSRTYPGYGYGYGGQ
jgi:hypothetical protein